MKLPKIPIDQFDKKPGTYLIHLIARELPIAVNYRPMTGYFVEPYSGKQYWESVKHFSYMPEFEEPKEQKESE